MIKFAAPVRRARGFARRCIVEKNVKETPLSAKRSLLVPVIVLALMWGTTAAAAPIGLEFLEPQDVAYVEVRGTVLDDTTGAPVQGATVLAVWEGSTYVGHSTSYHCLRVDAATTQADGRFSLRTAPKNVYRPGMAQQYVEIRIHAPGMQERLGGGAARTLKSLPDQRALLARLMPPKEVGLEVRVPMIPTKEDLPDRIRTLQLQGRQPKYCETLGDTAAVQRFFQALASEAQRIAETRYQKAVAQALAAGAATAATALGKEESSSADIMRPVYASPELSDLERRDAAGATPLMKAAGEGDVARVRALLAAGASPNRTLGPRSSSSDESALTRAMQGYFQFRSSGYPPGRQFAATIQALLADPKVDPNVRGVPDGYTPLMVALQGRQDDVVEWLLAAGADPNLTAYGGRFTALGMAIKALDPSRDEKTPSPANRQFDLLLASRRINLDAHTEWEGEPAVTSALAGANLRVVKQLLEAGANPNALDRGKRTPLIASVVAALMNPQRPRYGEGVRLIASWPGVDFSAQYQGKTALQMAQSAGRRDLVEMLERH